MGVSTQRVQVDLVDFLAGFGPDAAQQLVQDLASAARDHWMGLAADQLHSSATDYIAGIQEVEQEGSVVRIVLVGTLPNLVEQGMDAFDLRTTLLGPTATGKVHTNKQGGRYRVIPFRQKTPGTRAQGGLPMGQAYAPSRPNSLAAPHAIVEDWEKLGRAVHRRAKALRGNQQLPAGLAPLHRPHHKTDLFAGMVRRAQPTRPPGDPRAAAEMALGGNLAGAVKLLQPGPAQYTYFTFRTISQSNPVGWQHPGIKGRHLVKQVADWIGEVAPEAIASFAANAILDAEEAGAQDPPSA